MFLRFVFFRSFDIRSNQNVQQGRYSDAPFMFVQKIIHICNQLIAILLIRELSAQQLQFANSIQIQMQSARDVHSILKYSNKLPAVSSLVYLPALRTGEQLRSQLNDYIGSHHIATKAKTNQSNHFGPAKANQRYLIQLDKKENIEKRIMYSQKQIIKTQKSNPISRNQLAVGQQFESGNVPTITSASKEKDESFASNSSNIDINIDNSADNHEQKIHNEPRLQGNTDKQLLTNFNNTDQKQSQVFEISRQVAITYISYSNRQEKYTRFRSNQCINNPTGSFQSIKGSMTDQNSEVLHQAKPPFTTLHQIQLFLQMYETKQKRAQQLLHVNEKILLAQHNLQKVNESLHKELEEMQAMHSKQLIVLNNNLKEREGEIAKLKVELQSQMKHIAQIKNLNELYVKQNNDLKKKHRDNFKEVQLLRRDLHAAIKQNEFDKPNIQSNTKEQSLNTNRRTDDKPKIVYKLKNCRSQECIQRDIGSINTIAQDLLKMPKDKDDRSISSIASCLSRRSAVQKIGFVSKPKDRVSKDGMMVDLLLDNASHKGSFHSKEKDQQLQKSRHFRKETID